MKILQLSPVYRRAFVTLKTDTLPYILPMLAIALVERECGEGKKTQHLPSIVLTSKKGLKIIDERSPAFSGHSYDV